jgi:hypothetical protein
MPETAMHKDYCLVFRQHDVRIARKVLSMQAETEATFVKHGAYGDLRLCIPAADA